MIKTLELGDSKSQSVRNLEWNGHSWLWFCGGLHFGRHHAALGPGFRERCLGGPRWRTMSAECCRRGHVALVPHLPPRPVLR